MSDVEVLPQPRIDTRALALTDDGSVRHTEYRGTIWFGGRPEVRAGMLISRGRVMGPSEERTWLPDSLAYRTEAVGGIAVAASAALQSIREDASVLDVSAELSPHPEHPDLSYVLITITAVAMRPLGVAYQVVVAAPTEAVAG